MLVEDVVSKLDKISNIPIGEIFEERGEILWIDKGRTGKLLEKIIGLPNSSALKDLENGEIKTYKSNIKGHSVETICISMISKHFDNTIVAKLPFEETWIFEKIKNVIFVPIVKNDGNEQNWYFKKYMIKNLIEDKDLFDRLKKEYEEIVREINYLIDDGQDLHTINGDGRIRNASKAYLQIRTKDSGYNCIFSKKHNRFVSHRNYAFYFKNLFSKEILYP